MSVSALLSERERRRLAWFRRLPLAWTRSRRRRRLLLLALAGPGCAVALVGVADHDAVALFSGVLVIAGASGFRRVSEPLFTRAEALRLWPPPTNSPLAEVTP